MSGLRIDPTAARVVLYGYGLFAAGVRDGRGLVACPYRLVTGRRCPFCGLTGAVGHALRGRVGRSLATHPLGVPVALAIVLDLFRGCRDLAWGISRAHGGRRTRRPGRRHA